MKKNNFITILIVVFAALVAYSLYLKNTQFYIISSSNQVAYEVDRKTGKTWKLSGDTKTEQIDFSSPKQQLKPIPDSELAKLTGSMKIYPSGISGSFYNGSDWVVRQIIFCITIKEANGSVRWSREYIDNVNILPMTSGVSSFDITESNDFGDWTCRIIRALGVPHKNL